MVPYPLSRVLMYEPAPSTQVFLAFNTLALGTRSGRCSCLASQSIHVPDTVVPGVGANALSRPFFTAA